MIRRLIRSRFLQSVAAAAIIYGLADLLFPQGSLNTLMVAISLCIAGAVVVMYGSVAIEEGSLVTSSPSSFDRIVIGILLSWTSRMIFSAVGLVSIIAGDFFGTQFNATAFYGWTFLVQIVAGVYHVNAPLVENRGVKSRNWGWLFVSFIAGAAIAGFVAGVAWWQHIASADIGG